MPRRSRWFTSRSTFHWMCREYEWSDSRAGLSDRPKPTWSNSTTRCPAASSGGTSRRFRSCSDTLRGGCGRGRERGGEAKKSNVNNDDGVPGGDIHVRLALLDPATTTATSVIDPILSTAGAQNQKKHKKRGGKRPFSTHTSWRATTGHPMGEAVGVWRQSCDG